MEADTILKIVLLLIGPGAISWELLKWFKNKKTTKTISSQIEAIQKNKEQDEHISNIADTVKNMQLELSSIADFVSKGERIDEMAFLTNDAVITFIADKHIAGTSIAKLLTYTGNISISFFNLILSGKGLGKTTEFDVLRDYALAKYDILRIDNECAFKLEVRSTIVEPEVDTFIRKFEIDVASGITNGVLYGRFKTKGLTMVTNILERVLQLYNKGEYKLK